MLMPTIISEIFAVQHYPAISTMEREGLPPSCPIKRLGWRSEPSTRSSRPVILQERWFAIPKASKYFPRYAINEMNLAVDGCWRLTMLEQ